MFRRVESEFSTRSSHHELGDDPVSAVVVDLAGGRPVDFVWRNQHGGLTFRVGEQFVKWSPRRAGIDLERERARLEWIAPRHPAPRVIASRADDQAQWLVTEAVPGEPAVGETWQARRSDAVHAVAAGLRALHAIAIDDYPAGWTSQVWVGRRPRSLEPRPGDRARGGGAR